MTRMVEANKQRNNKYIKQEERKSCKKLNVKA